MEVNVDKSPMFELRILRSENSEEFTKISFYKLIKKYFSKNLRNFFR